MHARSQGKVSAADRRSGSRSAAASARSSTTASRPRRTSRTPPGLQVVACSNPVDAYCMIQQAIACRRPGHLLRAQAPLLGEGRASTSRRRSPTRTPLHRRRVVREGTDVTVAGVRADGEDLPGGRDRRRGGGRSRSRSSTCARCRRSTSTPSRASVRRRPAGWSSCTRRRCSSASAPRSPPGSPSSASTRLEAPVLRVGGFDTPYPPRRLEEEYLPDLDRVLDAVDRSLAF